MSPTLRKVILQVHRWTGLTVGLVIVMLAVTAAIIVFRPQLEPVTSAHLFDVGQCTTPVSLDALAESAVKAHPGIRPEDIRIRPGGREAAQIRFADRELLYVDPCSGKVLGEQNKYGGLFGLPEKLHRFKFIDGEAGTAADGTITLIFALVLVAGGLIVWWPPTLVALKSALKFRPHLRGIALTLNLHNVVGIYTSLVLLVTTLTALPISFQWARDGINWITGSPARESKPSSKLVQDAQPVAMESLWQRAQALMPQPREAVLRYPRKPQEAVEIFLVGSDAPHSNARSYLYLDAYTGEVLRFTPYAQSSPGFKFYSLLVPLHTGEIGGVFVQLLFFLGMVSVPVLAYTGFSSYLRRRFQAVAQPAPLKLRVQSIRYETEEIKSFRLVATNRKSLPSFTPGAHISVQIPDGLTRQYSLCNGPGDTSAYHIAVKREPDSRGGSRVLHERVAEGDTLEVMAPRNHFPVETSAKHHLLLAGGIGITPLLSMARHLQATGASFELQYFTRSVKFTAFHEVLSQPEFSGKVNFHYALDPQSLRVYLHTLLRHRPEEGHLYACGPRPFMDLVEDIATVAWPQEAIHMEFFAADPLASSGPRQPFEITLARTRASYTVPAERSILQVLAEHGIRISNSCEQGVCGTCVTGVLEGTPDHRDAFLSERERKACDKMMLCVSRAKSERLVLDL
jgi:vanillate O-demethylase ferredoxin subunit